MTPGARVAAAIAVLDQIQSGTAAEQALTAWARGSRYAGSKDRAAVRDFVFDVLRRKRSLGDGTGRSLLIHLVAETGVDVATLFTGEGHAPAPLSPQEMEALRAPRNVTPAAFCDIPEWLWPDWLESLGDAAEPVAQVQQARADVFLRVNQRRGAVEDAVRSLADDGIAVVPHPSVVGCLRVTQNPRRVKAAHAYQSGLVELQDAASQQAVRNTPVPPGARILDYCAGGGGKALAFADQHAATVVAHDIAPQRLRDLPARAKRAGVKIDTASTQMLMEFGKFDVVFCDAPCSGSGTWRRTPDAKWRLTAAELDALRNAQQDVLRDAASCVKDQGVLVYATCSVLRQENQNQIASFLERNGQWQIQRETMRLPDVDGDGFYTCILEHR